MVSKSFTRTVVGLATAGLAGIGLTGYSISKSQAYVNSAAHPTSYPSVNVHVINFRESSSQAERPARVEVYVDTSQNEILFGPRTTPLSERPSFSREEFALFATGTDTVRVGSESPLTYNKIADQSSVEYYDHVPIRGRPVRHLSYQKQIINH